MKITKQKFKQIKASEKLGMKTKQVAELLSLSPATISRIYKSDTYADYKKILNKYNGASKKKQKKQSVVSKKQYNTMLLSSVTMVVGHILSQNKDINITTDDGKQFLVSAKRIMRKRDN